MNDSKKLYIGFSEAKTEIGAALPTKS